MKSSTKISVHSIQRYSRPITTSCLAACLFDRFRSISSCARSSRSIICCLKRSLFASFLLASIQSPLGCCRRQLNKLLVFRVLGNTATIPRIFCRSHNTAEIFSYAVNRICFAVKLLTHLYSVSFFHSTYTSSLAVSIREFVFSSRITCSERPCTALAFH